MKFEFTEIEEGFVPYSVNIHITSGKEHSALMNILRAAVRAPDFKNTQRESSQLANDLLASMHRKYAD